MKTNPDFRTLLDRLGAGKAVRLAAVAALTWSLAAGALWGGTFGSVVPIGGQASDIALDEARGVLYIANYTANRIEVMNLADASIPTSINVAAQPGGLALSPDGRFLVITHGPGIGSGAPNNAVSVINLASNTRQTFASGYTPLGVAFTIDGQALIVTQQDFLLLDPASGATRVIDTLAALLQRSLPVSIPNAPPTIAAAAVSASPDGLSVYGQMAGQGANASDTIRFRYDMQNRTVTAFPVGSQPGTGPMAVSANADGSLFMAGFGLFNRNGNVVAQFATPSGVAGIGTSVFDSNGTGDFPYGTIYAQIPERPAGTVVVTPSLMLMDGDNLTLRGRIALPENLTGRSVLNAARDTIYSVSESGVVILPVGRIAQEPRITTSRDDIVFRGNFCDRRLQSQQIDIVNPGGGRTAFTLVPSIPGITVSPSSGFTPARVTVSIDPAQFQTQKGTITAYITIRSEESINLPDPIRVLINNREPDQRGTFVNVGGKPVDLLADPARQRYYVLRQGKNDVLVMNSLNQQVVATLRTSNTPTQMTITPQDSRYLIVGHDNSQFAYVYDLETLERVEPILFSPGSYPKTIAAANTGILAGSRRDPAGAALSAPLSQSLIMESADILAKRGSILPSLGIYSNDGTATPSNTVLTASPNGASIFGASASGTTFLYSTRTSPPTFVVARKDFTSLSGAYAASNSDQYLVGDNLLNASLVLSRKLSTTTGVSSGFVFADQAAWRIGSLGSSQAGVIQGVNLAANLDDFRAVRTTESPIVPDPTGAVFTRSLVLLADRSAFVSLTQSGVMVLSRNYDAPAPIPTLDRLVNSADLTKPVAPGGLITVFGGNLSPVNLTTSEIPLPTALADSCLAVNGVLVPLIFVSPGQINAQLPFNLEGNSTAVLRTPGGVSNNLNFTVLANAPAIFRNGTAGDLTGIPVIVRATNNTIVTLSNPVHKGDDLTIYTTGLGKTTPTIDAGIPSPGDPAALALVEPQVLLDGADLAVNYAGLAPGQIGVYQINVKVPFGIQQGLQIPLVIRQGAGETSVALRVVE